MTSRIFGGFELVDGTSEDFNLEDLDNKNKMYLVRTDDSGTTGYIYFNNKQYGTESDIIDCGTF